MWFSYPGEESWIPLTIERVREIQQMNREGEKPDDLKDEAVEIEPSAVSKILDYENVVGQDSLTRLDEKGNKKKKKRGGKNRNRQENIQGAPVPRAQSAAGTPAVKDAGRQKPEVKPRQQQAEGRSRNIELKPRQQEAKERSQENRGQQNAPQQANQTGGQPSGQQAAQQGGQPAKKHNGNRHHRRHRNNNRPKENNE